MSLSVRIWSIIAFACLVSSESFGYQINVANSSFETLPAGGLSACDPELFCYTDGQGIPGWDVSPGSQGQADIGLNFGYIPDGSLYAWSNGGTISQTVVPTAVTGTTYTLLVYEGFRDDSSAGYLLPDNATISLQVGAGSADATGLKPQYSGAWALQTATYTATAADAGLPIVIDLYSPGAQATYDDVSLTAASGTPEPAAWALMLIGLGCVGAVARYRTRGKHAVGTLG